VRAVADRMGIQESQDPELGELSQDVHPDRVLDKIDESNSGKVPRE